MVGSHPPIHAVLSRFLWKSLPVSPTLSPVAGGEGVDLACLPSDQVDA